MKVSSLALLLIATGLLTPFPTQDDNFCASLQESHIRQLAIEKVTPVYPEEALRSRFRGRLEVKLEIGADGEVRKVKLSPKTPLLLKEPICRAVKKWRFIPYPDRSGLGRSVLSRLRFTFSIRNGAGLVKLYQPRPNAPDSEGLGYYHSSKEMNEWRDWPECPNN
jgi:TonB family protein